MRTLQLSGFDANGEPQIEVMADGTLRVAFEFMPPSDVDDRRDMGPYHDFDVQMSKAIGVPVTWEDREVFLIDAPKADTIERLITFVSTYRSR
ncbi:hypothetical protein [Polyangium sorediatum]|uniref:Uncharacterized protein n=1 Tax=Polyangium sorediatum TaxID=889274 RepID=A0ABT6NMH5_9BACT|nr:hypothetical protein [Polyangium sorediatum]MDI1429519.1 hypothetical protein [Polyangium sorediatum]